MYQSEMRSFGKLGAYREIDGHDQFRLRYCSSAEANILAGRLASHGCEADDVAVADIGNDRGVDPVVSAVLP